MINSAIFLYALFLMLILYFIQRLLPKYVQKDKFNVYNLFFAFAFAEIPYLFFIGNSPEKLHPYVAMHIINFEGVFLQHLFLEMLFFFFAILAMYISQPKPKVLIGIFTNNFKYNYIIHIIFLILSFVVFYMFLKAVGGLYYILLNLSVKTEVMTGTGYYRNAYLFFSFMAIGFLLEAYSNLKRLQKIHIIYFILIVVTLFLLLSATGARKNPLLFILYTIVLWNYKIKNIKIVSFKNIIIIFFFVAFAAVVPLFRETGATEYYANHINELFAAGMENAGQLFKRFSDIDRSLFIYSYFDFSNLWWGASFHDLLTAPIPKIFIPDKPPTDEGVYIYALAHGKIVSPPTPFYEMYPVGWPLSRVTGMYINFWYFGVAVGGIIVGYLLKYFYIVFTKTGESPQATLIYLLLLFTNFGLTNLMIVNNLVMLVFAIIISISLKILVNILAENRNLKIGRNRI